MKTLIQYAQRENKDKENVSSIKTATFPFIYALGYLNVGPEEVLEKLISSYHIIGYLGLLEPYCHTSGLIISSIPHNIFGINGSIDMLIKDKRIEKAKHEPLNQKQKEKMYNEIIERIKHTSSTNSLNLDTALKYSVIFDKLGFPTSVNYIIELSKNKNDYKPNTYIFNSKKNKRN